jgi:carbamoyltransferase
MTNGCFDKLFGHPVRQPDQPLTPFHMDIAASIQAVTEEVMLRLARSIRVETGMDNLCLAGGVALNCVANWKIVAEGIYKNVWIQPAAGDAGGAVGAALAAYYLHQKRKRVVDFNRLDGMQGSYLGPAYVSFKLKAPNSAHWLTKRWVQNSLHGGRTWIAENGAITESTWTEFHAALHPADGLSFAQ